MGTTAGLHGRDLFADGYSVHDVVHDDGDLCQAVTELAGERAVDIAVDEFHTLNRCLDNAIADAVRAHAEGQDASDWVASKCTVAVLPSESVRVTSAGPAALER